MGEIFIQSAGVLLRCENSYECAHLIVCICVCVCVHVCVCVGGSLFCQKTLSYILGRLDANIKIGADAKLSLRNTFSDLSSNSLGSCFRVWEGEVASPPLRITFYAGKLNSNQFNPSLSKHFSDALACFNVFSHTHGQQFEIQLNM